MFLVRTVNVVVGAIFFLSLIVLELNDLVVKSVCSPLLLATLLLINQPTASEFGTSSAQGNLLSLGEVMNGA